MIFINGIVHEVSFAGSENDEIWIQILDEIWIQIPDIIEIMSLLVSVWDQKNI